MKLSDASEIVTGLALKGRISLNSLRPELFMSPDDEVIKELKQGTIEKEDLILKFGLSVLQPCWDAEQTLTGAGTANWLQILEQSHLLYSTGQQLEKYAKKMSQGEEHDIAQVTSLSYTIL